MIIWLASYPRSGNGFLRTVLKNAFGRGSESRYKSDSKSLKHSNEAPATEADLAAVLDQLAKQPELHFVKTHELPGEDRYPAIYLVRDGRDALVSRAWYTLEVFHQIDRSKIDKKALHEKIRWMIDGPGGRFGGWSQNVLSWTSRPQTAVVRFESLIESPIACVSNALNQLGLTIPVLPDAAVPTFDQLRSKSPQLYRRGVVGSWRDEFPPDLLSLFWQHHGRAMKTMGYQRQAA